MSALLPGLALNSCVVPDASILRLPVMIRGGGERAARAIYRVAEAVVGNGSEGENKSRILALEGERTGETLSSVIQRAHASE